MAWLSSDWAYRREITIEQVLKSPLVADPLRLFDCSPISDGAAAVIIIVGGIVSLVGFVLLTVAFFSTQEVETAQPAPPVA